MNAKVFPVLIRREFWEHRVLWMAPLVIAALYVLACFIPGAGIHVNGDMRAPVSAQTAPFLYVQLLFTAALFALMSLVVFFYLADCLYAERKDRSILFWKSLPVSDASTVLSKLVVALIITPLGVYVLALVTNLVAFGILFARFHNNALLQPFVQWDTGAWLHMYGVLLLDVAVLALWYAPVAAYQLLVSAWAKGSVFVWTILPPLIVVFGERLVLGTWRTASIISQRLGISFGGIGGSGAPRGQISATLGAQGVLDRIDATGLLLTFDMWIGVAIAAALIFATVRIRRYRDDT